MWNIQLDTGNMTAAIPVFGMWREPKQQRLVCLQNSDQFIIHDEDDDDESSSMVAEWLTFVKDAGFLLGFDGTSSIQQGRKQNGLVLSLI